MKLILAILVFVICAGCASLEKTAFVTVGSVGLTANAAIGGYMDWIKEHPPKAETLARVRKAVQAYVDAMESTRTVVLSYKQGQVGKDSVRAALVSLNTAAAELSSAALQAREAQ